MRPRWHTVPGLVARRDRTVTLILEVEQCDATHPEHGRCEAIRNHNAPGRWRIPSRHGNAKGAW